MSGLELKPCPFCGESKLLYSGGCGFRYDDDDNQIRLFRVHCRTCKGRTGLFESLDEAVEAWNRRTNSTTIQPSALGTNLASLGTDCISRQAAIDALRDYLVGKRCPDDGTLTCRLIENEVINKLPTAEPKRGKWIRDGHHIRCDQCGMYMCDTDREGDRIPTEFCPNCGADMRGEQDE